MQPPKLFEKHVDTLLELELATGTQAVKPFLKPFRQVLMLLNAVWPGDDAPHADKQAALSRLNTEAFMEPLPEVERVILSGALEALSHGLDAGLTMAGLQGSAMAKTFKRQLPVELDTVVRATNGVMRRRVDRGTALLSQAQTLQEAQGALMLANPSTSIKAHARWLTNRASNEGITQVGEADPRSVLIWRAERDACVHCLAYQGHVRIRGKYPTGLTFGKKPLHKDTVRMPPLHPNCRCTQWIISREVSAPVIQGLLREAERSILRGWSVESESEQVRIDAARKLLAKHPKMPKSVQAYARSAVRAGEFKRGREFPA